MGMFAALASHHSSPFTTLQHQGHKAEVRICSVSFCHVMLGAGHSMALTADLTQDTSVLSCTLGTKSIPMTWTSQGCLLFDVTHMCLLLVSMVTINLGITTMTQPLQGYMATLIGEPTCRVLKRPYGRVDRPRLKKQLLARCIKHGGPAHPFPPFLPPISSL